MKIDQLVTELEGIGKMLSSKNLKVIKQAISVLQDLVMRAESTEAARVDSPFQQWIDRVRERLASSKVETIREAIHDIEGVAASAELECRHVWAEWKKAAGPIGAERLGIMAKRYVLHQLMDEARRVERNLGATTGLKVAGGKVYTMPAARLDLSAELSFREIDESIVDALMKESANYYYWPISTYRKRVVYEQTERTATGYGETKLYRRSYAVQDDDTVALTDDKMEVERKVQFVDALSVSPDGTIRLVRQAQ